MPNNLGSDSTICAYAIVKSFPHKASGMSRLRSNILYSIFLAISNYIFPLLVYPYISRVLGVTNIGICNFVDSVIHYFMLASMMGITIVGTREISSCKNDRIILENKFSSLFTLNAITTLIALFALASVTFAVPQFKAHKWMMAYGGLKIVSNFFLIEWFYKGLENFKFITLRTIIVKCLFVVCVYVFINDPDDYSTYYLLTALMITGNAVINMGYAHHFIRFNIKNISFRGVTYPFFILGLYMLVTSMCTTFNVTYLGFVSNDTEVGYYTTATKLYTLLLAFFTGATTAIMPHMSALIAAGNKKEFIKILYKAAHILFVFSIPIITFAIIYSSDIILLISGPGYEGAIRPLKIVMPLMLIIGYEQVIVIQGLMPLARDKVVMRNTIAGATLSIILNITLVPLLLSSGSAIAWLSSELLILILSQIALNKILSISFPFKYLFSNIAGYFPLAVILLIVNKNSESLPYWINLIIAASITITYILIIQIWIFRNPEFISNINHLKSKFNK